MIGQWSAYAEEFLIGLAAATFLFFTIPLLFVPLRWAKLMGFQIPAHTDLAVYFGRSVGGLAFAANFLALHAGLSGRAVSDTLLFIAAVAFVMTFIHIWGAIRKIQPLSETIEIGFWILMFLAALAVMPPV
jgi:hypothetical protein